jgi:small subunit ribosomal protein S17e
VATTIFLTRGSAVNYTTFQEIPMGIKPTYIKALGEEILSKHKEKFTDDFEANKVAVSQVTVMESKRVRNRVAGYITSKVHTRKTVA